jgi:hypothetical protein
MLMACKRLELNTISPGVATTRLCYLVLGLFTILLMTSFVLLDHLAPIGRRLSKVTGVDPPAYFGVCHALLFHRDFDLSDEFERVKPDDSLWTAVRKETGHRGSSYAIGYSVVAIPFLAAGTALDALVGNPADGYSYFAILGYCLANVILTCIGLTALFTFLHDTAGLWGVSGPRSAVYALFVTGAIFCGTSVGYYAFSQMSHASTFCCGSLFLACWWKVREGTDVRGWAVLGLIGGVLSICRWQDVFYLGAPLLFDLLDGGLRGVLPRLRSRAIYAGVIALCWIPQFLEWKYMYGRFFLIPQGEGFIVLPPHFIPQVLFSSQNGWFFWTPLALLGFCGLLFGAVKVTRVFLPWIVVIALEVALIGSLPITWHGGDSFSSRYLTSCVPLISLGLVTLIYAASGLMRAIVAVVAVACCLFAVLFAIQFRLDLILRHDRLTAAECFTDKLRLLQVKRRKLAVQQAETLLAQGSAAAAVQTLESAEKAYGDNRDLLSALSKAYRASGREADAEHAEKQWEILMQSRLW